MSLVIAAAQSSSFPGDVARNVAHHEGIATIAAGHGVQLLVFPELSLTGYELALARNNAVHPNDDVLAPLRDQAVRSQMTIVAGAPLPNEKGELYIGAIVFHPDGTTSTYAKVHVHHSEAGVFTSGPGGSTLRIDDATVALAICRDASIPEHAASAASTGANVYAVGAMVTEEDYPRKAALLTTYACDHKMAVLLANYSGTTGGDVSAGKSAIWSEAGSLITASRGAEEALIIGVKKNGVWSGTVSPLAMAAATGKSEF